MSSEGFSEGDRKEGCYYRLANNYILTTSPFNSSPPEFSKCASQQNYGFTNLRYITARPKRKTC